MNGAGVCWIIRETVSNVCICLNHSRIYKLKGLMKNQDIKRQFFQNLDNFYTNVFLMNRKNDLILALAKYFLSKLYSHCTQNCNFTTF